VNGKRAAVAVGAGALIPVAVVAAVRLAGLVSTAVGVEAQRSFAT
jgi:hypothetical protein